jgi:hypothetical protein
VTDIGYPGTAKKATLAKLSLTTFFTHFSWNCPLRRKCVCEPGLEADGDVASTGVNNALGQNGAKLSHHVLVLVVDHLNN